MRLIDADAAVKRLRNTAEHMKVVTVAGCKAVDIYAIPQFLEMLPTIDAVPVVRWIPVTERLPKDGVRVLALHDDGVVRIGISRGGYFPACVSKVHTKAFGIADVTHWMPLPEPPKEGE